MILTQAPRHHRVFAWLSAALLSTAFLTFNAETRAAPAASASRPARPAATRGSRVQRKSFPKAAAQERVSEFIGKMVSTIDVKGLKRIEKDAVLAKLATKPGSKLTTESARADIQALFAMGFFDDIAVEAAGTGDIVNLTYTLRERPVISQITFEGNERLATTDLQEVTKVKQWSILDVNKVKEDVALIQKHYEEKGFYLAKVNFDVKPVAGKEDEVELVFHVNDYDKVQIKKITFLNNKAFTDEQLKSALGETREGSFFSFMSGSGNFKESAFKQDLQRLTYFYLDHGYVKFKYENPVVTVSDDKKWLYISIYVEEGLQYQMNNLGFGGDLLFPRDELAQDLLMTQGQTFSISKRNQDIQHLTEKYQDLGYAFVNVIPKMNISDENKTIDIEYDFEKGNLVYFGEINILGNSKTHDKVIRRELKIHEGELYSGTKLRESRENVERLGYFAPGEVVFNTVTPKGKNDVVNVEITIKERSTGTITLGAGYGSGTGLFFTGQVSEINLLGRGQTISAAAQLAKDGYSNSVNLGFTDPYAFDSRWSVGGDLYYVKFPIRFKYDTRKLGADLRFGYPIYEFTYFYLTYKNEGLKVETDPSANNDPADIAADNGVLSSLVFQVVRDKRNNRFETTAGNYQSASVETAGVGGSKKFVKTALNNRYYQRVIGDLVFRNSIEFGHMFQLGNNPLPPAERFYLGGPNNLRGYDIFGVGPHRDRFPVNSTKVSEPVGGVTQMFGLFELEYPLIRDAGLKSVVFYDVGNAFSRFPTWDEFSLRQDAGFGFRWFSPIGPLRFEWGFPLATKAGEDKGSVFNFFIGTPF